MKNSLQELAMDRSLVVLEELELHFSSSQETEEYIWSSVEYTKNQPENLNQNMAGLIIATFEFDRKNPFRESFFKRFIQTSLDFCKEMKGYGALPLSHYTIWKISIYAMDRFINTGKPEIANIYFHKLFPDIRMDLTDEQFNQLLSKQIRMTCEMQDNDLTLHLIQRQQMLKLPAETMVANLLNEADVYRDTGDLPNLEKTLETLEKFDNLNKGKLQKIKWQRSYFEGIKKKNLSDMVQKCFGRSSEFNEIHEKLVCYLLVQAQSNPRLVKKVHKISTLRRTIAIETTGRQAIFYKATHLAEKVINSSDPWDKKMSNLEQIQEQCIPNLAIFERRLLISALLRWAHQSDKPLLTDMLLSRISNETLSMTDTATNLWFINDVQVQRAGIQSPFVDNLRYSVVDRSLSIINLGIKTASSQFRKYAKSLVSPSRAKEIEKEEIQRLRQLIMKECQNLKGPALKLAQIFASINHDDQPNLGVRKMSSVSAIHPNRIADMLRSEMSKDDGLLRNLDPRPIGAASIGQVHRSYINDIGEVVVKIQYPGIEQVVETDLKLIKLVLPIVKNIFPSTDVDSYYQSTKETFLRECNYNHEKDMQVRYFDYIQRNFPAEAVVPEVYDKYSSPKIITMSFIKGMNLSELIASGQDFDRNQVAQNLYRILWTGLLTEGFVMGDPHLENFIYTEDKRLGIIDYGLSEQLPKSRLVNWIGCLRAARDKDREALLSFVEEIELFKGHEDMADIDAFENSARKLFFLDQIGQPVEFSPGVSSNKNSDLTYRAPNRKYLTPRIEDSMFLRFALLTNLLMSRFNAVADWGQIISDILEEAHDFHNGGDQKNKNKQQKSA